MIVTAAAATAGAVVGGVACFVVLRLREAARSTELQTERDRLLEEARARAHSIEDGSRSKADAAEKEARNRVENEAKERRKEIGKIEKRLASREESLDQKFDRADERIREINKREQNLRKKEKTVEDQAVQHAARLEDAQRQLERVAGLTREDARDELVAKTVDEARSYAATQVRTIEEEARAESEKRSKWIIATAIQRYGGEYVAERTVSVVALPSDDMKGRIIGREGRNIRAIEAATGCDVIIDDTPDAVVVSCFNPVRREVGRMSLERLLTDGRIHPSRVEEVVRTCEREVESEIRRAGEKAANEVGVSGIHPELVKLIGRLKYRYSYAQNVWTHSVECGFLAGLMAGELRLNVKLARRAGLLHDIGKAVDHEVEGGHAVIGAKLAKKYGEREEVVNAIAAHHDDVAATSVYTHLAAAADALSGARPGARRETMESHIQRLEELEAIASGFKGVDRSYAVQAGREVRVVVEHTKVDDAGAVMLSRDIARKIEDDLTYPGQVKVCVIRETRAVEFAR